jgi:hypothetical protein
MERDLLLRKTIKIASKKTENTCYLNTCRQVANHLRNINWITSLKENMEPADFTHMSYFDNLESMINYDVLR